MTILVTGGAGYIGTHTLIELIQHGHDTIVVDNLANSNQEALRRVEEITGTPIPFYKTDVSNAGALREVFERHQIDAVIHFAGLKAVGESTENPLLYYRTNIDSTLALLQTMNEFNVKKLVFSSSATVYGSAPIPYVESDPAGHDITSPYGKTKYMIEEILSDTCTSDSTLEFTSLRYFNPIGAHPSGRIGEDPSGIPNNLMPYITQVATGKRDHLRIWGNNYDTVDGTGVRDYIHVCDLAAGHLAALTHSTPGYHVYNLGSGSGTSVLQLVHAFEEATGQEIPYEIADRRPGDLPEFYADASRANQQLSWRTTKTIEDACRDSWNWQSHNPDGYEQ